MSGSSGAIVIGDYPVTDEIMNNPFAYPAYITFHSSFQFLKIINKLSLGPVTISSMAPYYDSDTPVYSQMVSVTYGMHPVGTNKHAILVVNGVSYPNGYTYYSSNNAVGVLQVFTTHGGQEYVHIKATITSFNETVPSVYISSLEVIVIG